MSYYNRVFSLKITVKHKLSISLDMPKLRLFWPLGISAYGTHCNDLLELPPSNSYPVRILTFLESGIEY